MYKESVSRDMAEVAIRFGSFITKEKKVDKYFGDMFSEGGLSRVWRRQSRGGMER